MFSVLSVSLPIQGLGGPDVTTTCEAIGQSDDTWNPPQPQPPPPPRPVPGSSLYPCGNPVVPVYHFQKYPHPSQLAPLTMLQDLYHFTIFDRITMEFLKNPINVP